MHTWLLDGRLLLSWRQAMDGSHWTGQLSIQQLPAPSCRGLPAAGTFAEGSDKAYASNMTQPGVWQACCDASWLWMAWLDSLGGGRTMGWG
jgi:hypothetical protein